MLSKCYFPLLPFCKVLPKEYKEAFHENIDIDNPKSKLSTLMEESDDLIAVNFIKLKYIYIKYKKFKIN